LAKRRIITSKFVEDIILQNKDTKQLALSYSIKLLETAKEDLNSAKTSPATRKRNASSDLQQAVEKTTKAYYVLSGATLDDLHDVNHITPKAFFKMFEEHESFILDFCLKYRKMLKYWKKPEDLKNILTRKKELAGLTKEEIQSLFALLDAGYEKTRHKIANIGVIGAKQILTQLSKEGLGRKFLSPQLINEFALDKNLQFVLVDLFIALLYLYVLGLITFPHAQSRYPEKQLIDYRSNYGLSECIDLVVTKTEFAITSLEIFLQKMTSIKVKLAVIGMQNTTII
jgi:hypothetical protein